MARKSRMSILKRQRELKKSEKAAEKRARRQGLPIEVAAEPMPTFGVNSILGIESDKDDDAAESHPPKGPAGEERGAD